jgi:hypothetical protein
LFYNNKNRTICIDTYIKHFTTLIFQSSNPQSFVQSILILPLLKSCSNPLRHSHFWNPKRKEERNRRREKEWVNWQNVLWEFRSEIERRIKFRNECLKWERILPMK